MCDSGSSILFVDKSLVSNLQLQGRKASLSVAGIHGSQDVKTEIVPIAVSAHEKSRPLTTVQFYVHEKLKLGDQIVELQELKDRYPHLRNFHLRKTATHITAKSELQSKRCSSDSWTRLLRYSSPF